MLNFIGNLDALLQNALRHHQAGNLAQAEAIYLQMLQIDPRNVSAHLNLGTIADTVGRYDISVERYRIAIAIDPRSHLAHSNLAATLDRLGQFGEAVAECRLAIALCPDYAEAYNNLGNSLTHLWQLDEAVAVCRRAIELRPDLAGAYQNLGNALIYLGRAAEGIAAYRRMLSLDPNNITVHGNLIVAMHCNHDSDGAAVAREQRSFNERFARPLGRQIAPHGNTREPDRPLRIGYLSPDFRNHALARFMLPLLANHDKSKFNIFAYSNVASPDPVTEQLRSLTPNWRDISKMSDEAAASLIRADQIDILVDLAMHSTGHRLLVFARKPAPVQATYLAYPSGTGLEAIDYRLGDPHLDPPGSDRSAFAEQTARLPETYWCYQPALDFEIDPAPCASNGFVTFGSAGHFSKVGEAVIAAWIEILRAVPNSRLLLHTPEGSPRAEIAKRFASHGVDPARLGFTGLVALGTYLRNFSQIDIALDTFPYAGGTTTCDALWMGVPVVTLAGTMPIGRSGVSILSNVGLRELIAKSPADYVRIASELAGDRARLGALRAAIRPQMQQSPLMNAQRFAKNIEAAFRTMWENYCKS